ncbi:MAG: hypothetical protein KGL39_23200 [Patescibacteria group bacterium]|nr:hypothetical protein [Patescibacteria group bacterium]
MIRQIAGLRGLDRQQMVARCGMAAMNSPYPVGFVAAQACDGLNEFSRSLIEQYPRLTVRVKENHDHNHTVMVIIERNPDAY